ncbi:MAG: lysoplasmalogenase family protein [Bacillota bacterium]
MKKAQIAVLAVYLMLTAAILVFNSLCYGSRAVNYFKFAVVFSLLVTALVFKKRFREQGMLTAVVLFMALGDFFLNFCSTIPWLAGDVKVFGVLGFFFAYLLLIIVFERGDQAGLEMVLFFIPVLVIALPAAIITFPFVDGEVLLGLLLFGAVLCYMTWSAICTISRGYYSQAAARRFALAGYLILVSDICIAVSTFNPSCTPPIALWLNNIVWGTFIPAWALIVVNIAEEDL